MERRKTTKAETGRQANETVEVSTSTAEKAAKRKDRKPRPSQKGARTRKRVAKGVYSDRYGWAATVKVDGRQRERRFPRNTPVKTIRRWQDETPAALRTLPRNAKHTLAADAERYLKQVDGQVVGIAARRHHIETWFKRFGHLQTLQLAHHLNALNEQMREWRKRYSASTCKHRRTALTHLVKVLYGQGAAVALSDLVRFPPGRPKARWLEREHITDVLHELEPGRRMTARLQMLHYTGMRPAQLGRLEAENFRLDDDIPHVLVPAAKGGEPAAIPLSADGIEAAREFMALKAYGPVDTTRANVLLRKAARQAGRPGFTTYQIRHSFATALRRSGADLADIQSLYGHTNAKTTAIYAPEQLEKQREAVERMSAADRTARRREPARTGDASHRDTATGSTPAKSRTPRPRA